ncbi:hypothetical protein DL95DRAFT_404746 [Leptodontidium sp. 2 PMI_412]|nr:hypothetical protein DL95DRAFT_404746 [Leptodontidium sp. 2 PMI_412]
MRFFALAMALVAMPLAMAEPIPAVVGVNAEPALVGRSVLLHPRQDLPPCCSVGFSRSCDCGSCPILTCQSSRGDLEITHTSSLVAIPAVVRMAEKKENNNVARLLREANDLITPRKRTQLRGSSSASGAHQCRKPQDQVGTKALERGMAP